MAALAEAEAEAKAVAVAWEPCCISQAFDRAARRDPTRLSAIHAATASSATRSLQVDGKVVKVKIWDTAGQDSNASDALDKLKFLSVTDPSVLADGGEMEIRIKPDLDAGTITITDTGIGMTEDELKDCLGTIAQSGTSKFLKALKRSKAIADAVCPQENGTYEIYN